MKYEKDKTELIKTRLSKTIKDEMFDYCTKYNIKLSDLIREAVIKQVRSGEPFTSR